MYFPLSKLRSIVFFQCLNCISSVHNNHTCKLNVKSTHKKICGPNRFGQNLILNKFTHISFSIICCMASELDPAKKSFFHQISVYPMVLNQPTTCTTCSRQNSLSCGTFIKYIPGQRSSLVYIDLCSLKKVWIQIHFWLNYVLWIFLF